MCRLSTRPCGVEWKGGARKFLTWHRIQKKTDFFQVFFGSPDVKNEGFVAAKRTFSNHTKWKPQKPFFFFRPWWLKLMFRWGETPISTLESCACHRKMIITLSCPFTKSHKYHVSSFWRQCLEIQIDNPSQGAVSTAYLVYGCVWLCTVVYGCVRLCMVVYGMVWYGMVWYGMYIYIYTY